MTSTSRTPGFTLIEFMISVALLAILVALGMPNFVTWINNTRTRTFAESVANGLRLAQSEATRRSRSVQFSLTGDGLNWSVQTIPLPIDQNGSELIEKSQLSGANLGITTTASSSVIVFNSIGRLSSQYGNPKTQAIYKISNANGNRPLWVTVSPGGQVRLCDPNIPLTSTSPTGCTPS
jgi:type IV fimbrial biogenesis protein FimT